MWREDPALKSLLQIGSLMALMGCIVLWSNCAPPTAQNPKSEKPGNTTPGSENPGTPGEKPGNPQDSGDRRTPPPPPPGKLTYHEHVRTIIEQKCLGCHSSKGVGPFSLTNYKETKAVSQAIKAAVQAKRMPPWPADGKCAPYLHSMDLSDQERETILNWIGEGAPEGDPSKYVKPKDKGNVGLPRVDVSLKMPEPYTPTKSPDDHRCFVLEWDQKERTYITGFQVKPGNAKIVHHVIAYLADAKQLDAARKLDASEPGPGYYCPGGVRLNNTQWIAAWAPGKPGGTYPEGTGIQIEPGSVIIIQVHYNTLTAKPESDQSAVEVMVEKQVKERAFILPIAATRFRIPKDEKNYVHQQIFPNSLKIPIRIHAVSLHMHLLGKSSRIWIKRGEDGGNKDDCLLNIPRWDFNWQYFYDLKDSLVVGTKDAVGIECTWDNSPGNQALVNGKRRQSRDVTWGDGTVDEMCLGVLYVTGALRP